MPTSKQINRIALRKDQVLEVQLGPWPEPPPEMLKLPGIQAWWLEMKLARNRDIDTFNRIINNLGIATSTP
jgi:hypothetical protein